MQDTLTSPADAKSPRVSPTAAASAGPPAETVGPWTTLLVIALFVVLGHAGSINTGQYLDDYAHYQHLREGNWSYRSAVESSRLGIVGEVLDLWGRQEAGLKFYRPIAFWTMRAEYAAVRWHPLPMHMLSLCWHLGCSLLVAAIATRCLGRRFWGLVAGVLMAIHPAHVGTVYWIACQTELMTTFLLLLGLLAYAKYAGWPTPWFGKKRRGDAETQDLPSSFTASPCLRVSASVGFLYAIAAMVCYGLALGCRENAALFPVVCWMGDRLIGTSRPRWVRWEHVGFGVVLAVYMALRYQALGGFPVPPPPYLMPISASMEFVNYVAYKVVMYALGLFFFVPVVPIGSLSFFAERAQTFYGLFAGVVLLVMLIWAGYRFRRAVLWPLAWLACLIAPMMLVFASPHHLYLPSLGMVLLVTAGLAALAGPAVTTTGWLARSRAVAVGCLTAIAMLAVGGMTWCMGYTYVRGVLSEDLLVRDVLRQNRPLRDGDHLFFINMPVLAYYAIPAIQQELGYKNLRGHVLVFSPDLIRMELPSSVDVIDKHRLRVRAPEDKRYLSGVTGTMLLGVMGIDRNLKKGQEFDAGEFTVTISDLDAGGVREMLFEFRKPIDSPDYHFYLGSPQFMAYELQKLSAVSSRPASRTTASATGN